MYEGKEFNIFIKKCEFNGYGKNLNKIQQDLFAIQLILCNSSPLKRLHVITCFKVLLDKINDYAM